MDDAFLRNQTSAILTAYAHGLGVAPEAFESGEITFVERAADAPWAYTALAITVPGGSVVGVAPGLLDLAEQNRPKKHYLATRPEFLRHFSDHANKIGAPSFMTGESICWALRNVPAPPKLPAGLSFQLKDVDWMNAEQPNLRFENGVGEPGVAGRSFRNKWAIAIASDDGEPIAVGGVFDTFGLDEVGVDVLRSHRGQHLGASVVAAVTREILERGGVPFYGCAASNVRSQRNAMSVGYVPVFTDASVT
jgi:hypothetical protein